MEGLVRSNEEVQRLFAIAKYLDRLRNDSENKKALTCYIDEHLQTIRALTGYGEILDSETFKVYSATTHIFSNVYDGRFIAQGTTTTIPVPLGSVSQEAPNVVAACRLVYSIVDWLQFTSTPKLIRITLNDLESVIKINQVPVVADSIVAKLLERIEHISGILDIEISIVYEPLGLLQETQLLLRDIKNLK